MASQTQTEKLPLRRGLPGLSSGSEPVQDSVAELKSEAGVEPIAQWKDNAGDRITFLVWMTCFGLMLLYVVVETILGFLF